uniref:Pyridoxal kinase n=1 Tax=Saimiri boliviensis boliviensis TaxID=39432 RepID=A0A2K6T3W0_SAIBB
VLGFEIDAVNSVQFSNHTGKARGLSVAQAGLRLTTALTWAEVIFLSPLPPEWLGL